MRLCEASSVRLPENVGVPCYKRSGGLSAVHFGIGAFHRAHQAAYTDACNRNGAEAWTMTGVSMRSASVAEQLNPQDGLYTLTIQSSKARDTRVIGSVGKVLVAGSDGEAIIDRLTSPSCHLVTFTVTEKGYCRAPDGSLDLALASNGFYPLLSRALSRRREVELPGLSLLSCDNLSGNGKQLGRLMREWIDAKAPDLRDWFDANCTTPDSMVDRIVPAPSADGLDALQQRIGLRDEGAVFTEGFTQWVIEDDFAGHRPPWETQGAMIVDDVAPYESAKLRLLNGAHSLLAYVGLDRGYTYVHQAIADPCLRTLVKRLMLSEAAPTIAAGKGQDMAQYAVQLVDRFENSALNHRLDQIAMDGSQKIGQRWLEVLAEQQGNDTNCDAILTGIAHWLHHVTGQVRPVEDPLADSLQRVCARVSGTELMTAIFGENGLVQSRWSPSEGDITFITKQLSDLG